MAALLETHNLHKYYEKHCALRDVSVAIPEGSVYGLLGPNGAGKTSLIRIITRITAPDQGKVMIQGREMTSDDINLIGYLPEERGLYKKMEVGDQLLYLAQLKGLPEPEAKKRLRMWFEEFGIQDWWKKKVEDLSKGMAQKVQFIATIVHRPKLLILDEPFTGFDPINENLVKDKILALKATGTTIIFSTHRMESVEELCDNIALINKSEKVLDGTTSEIRSRYRSHTWRITGTGTWPMESGIVPSDTKTLIDGSQQWTVKLSPNVRTNDLIGTVLPHISIEQFQEVVPSMKDIFISAVGGNVEL